MRFVSQFPELNVGIRPEKRSRTMDGDLIVTRPGIDAQFVRDAFTQRDLEIALQTFQFKGLYQHEDEATPVDPAYRIGIYDTDEEYAKTQETEDPWDLDTKAYVEQRLLQSPRYGMDHVVVPEKVIEPPWPRYLDFDGDATQLVLRVNEMGYEFEDVLAFESSKWGPRREDVIEAFQTAIQVRDEGKVVVGD